MANGEVDDGKIPNSVFLSITEDVTKSFPFISDIVDALQRHGVVIFPNDGEKPEAPEEVQRSRLAIIEKVQVAVVFFSRSYPFSAARLDESAKISDCIRTKDLEICPIFCDVEYHEVRCQMNSYKEGIAALEKGLGKDSDARVKGWRSALSYICGFSCFDFENRRSEEDIVGGIVSHVLNRCSSKIDVFISYSGEDQSCYSFTGFLYNALRQQRFKTFFRFSRLMQNGNQSMSPPNYAPEIARSKVSIIVFSESYAREERCLNELMEIVECNRSSKKQQVFPVFYNLEPSQVRYQTDSYALAMDTHETNYAKEDVQRWRSALFEVANLKGFTFQSGIEYEHQTIQKIVQLVNKYLPRYDVFLSFRGTDTRFNFTGHLYNELCRKGIKTFMDDDAMKYGEQISDSLKTAIQESKVAIIVFSEKYAYSTWTLEELAIILALEKRGKYHVFPVYYNVEPEHVWNQKGSYGVAMAKHEARLGKDSEEVLKWRKALSQVQKFESIITGTMDEYNLVERIADKVKECLRWLY